jgi:hypothetical protein
MSFLAKAREKKSDFSQKSDFLPNQKPEKRNFSQKSDFLPNLKIIAILKFIKKALSQTT